MNLKKLFLDHCDEKQYEINQNQLEVINLLKSYFEKNFNRTFFKNFFKNKDVKLGFYLVGDVGVGKTMILNFFYNQIDKKKLRLHFNEFMINFHDFIFTNKVKENGINNFVMNLSKKAEILYLDEFQVTNIVDAMILGRLFKRIFEEKISVIFSSNIFINELYKDGLQRDQFVPFIKVLEKNCHQKELLIREDYRSSRNISSERFLSPINTSTNFLFNKHFRKVTKGKNHSLKVLEIKGRKLILENFYERIIKFGFDKLCDRNLGSEDYIAIANNSDFIFISDLPEFSENNLNQQQRFITLIDIIYEKKIPLMITSEVNLDLMKSSRSMTESFKRTISRLYELTSISYI
jgi:predicted ATPase|tara:strand:+ start:2423 stop:3469 length:1047 start_codon:yes stop_codon:yes gene_type:complete